MSLEARSVPGGTVFRSGQVTALVTDRTGPEPLRNLSYTSGDPEEVAAARIWAARTVQADPKRQIWCRQVHGALASTVTAADAGAPDAPPIAGTDALVCAVPSIACGVLVADCTPVLLVGPDAYAVAHVGWRGLVAGIVQNTAAALQRSLGARDSTVTALLGPSIGPCCFEVGEDVASAFSRIAPDAVETGRAGGRPHVDLRRAIEVLLSESGVSDVATPFGCTHCDDRWFSHRRGNAERQSMVACLAPSRAGGGS